MPPPKKPLKKNTYFNPMQVSFDFIDESEKLNGCTYLNDLNKTQRQAVTTFNGQYMIIAGPGSGKTRVNTYRVAHLINFHNIQPYNILVLTFTNKAAREMRNRIEKLVTQPEQIKQITMGTFHAVFARILRIEAQSIDFPTDFTIYDTEDSKSLLRAIVRELQLDSDLYDANTLYNRISGAKNSLITPEGYRNNKDITANDQRANRPHIVDIYKHYTHRCKKAGAMDFDDLLLNMFFLLKTTPDVREKYQKKFQFIHLDEFQDTNFLQYEIIKLLAAQHKNILAVGDDAQSIYAFRGATVENMIDFKKDFPNAVEIRLEQNYRSTKNIIEVANQIIANNPRQLPKTIWTDNTQGDLIRLMKAQDDSDEGRLVVDLIKEDMLRNHFKPSSFAILYRTNAQSRIFEDALRKANIAYTIFGGTSFYQRKEIKDVLGYLRLTVNNQDDEALRRIINFPARGIGDTTFQKLENIANQNDMSIWQACTQINTYPEFNSRAKELVTNFVNIINTFKQFLSTFNAYEATEKILKMSGLWQNYQNDKTIEGLSKFENIQELLNSIQEFVSNKQIGVLASSESSLDNDASLGKYLQEISLLTDMDKTKTEAGSVQLMTVHNAKGLEFPCVHVVGMEEKLFPSKMASNTTKDIEEERRLFYVAVTRAEQKLTISYAARRYRFGVLEFAEASRFLTEIPQQYLEVRGSGIKASDFKYGTGTNTYESFSSDKISPLSLKNAIGSRPQTPNLPPANLQIRSDDLNKLKNADTVLHERFGKGQVQNIEGAGDKRIASIIFELYGEKRIMLKFVKMQIEI